MTIEQFLHSLEEFGILPKDEILAVRNQLPGEGEAAALAARLVADGKLTSSQAKAVLHGGASRLVCGDYLLLDRLGIAGLGKTYRARHRSQGRIVGIKIFRAPLKPRNAIRKFHHDLKAVARLEHPNLVRIYEAGLFGNLPYVAIECVRGTMLSKAVKKRGPLAVELALRYLADAARGLEYAHLHEIVHRDVRPSNLLLTAEGAVKVLDLGLVRPERRVVEPRSGGRPGHTGGIACNIDFMAPEQAADLSRVDRRSEIYSLGCILHYLLAGTRMYAGRPARERMLAHRNAPIPALQSPHADIPLAVERVFQRLVAKQPEDRYQTMAAAREALEQCLNPNLEPPAPLAEFVAPLLPPSSVPAPIAAAPAASPVPPSAIAVPRTQQAVPQHSFPQQAARQHAGGDNRPRRPPLPIWFVPGGLIAVLVLVIALVFHHRTPDDPSPHPPAAKSAAETGQRGQPGPSPATIANAKHHRLLPAPPAPAAQAISTPPDTPAAKRAPEPEPPSSEPARTMVGGKPPAPDSQTTRLAIAQIRDAYRADFEKAVTPWRKAELANELVSSVEKGRDASEKSYATLRLARTLAMEVGAADVACRAIDVLEARFEIDTLHLKTDTLIGAAQRLPAVDGPIRTTFADQVLDRSQDVAQQLLEANRYDLAKELSNQMLQTSAALFDATFAQPWKELSGRIEEQRRYYDEKFLPAREAIEQGRNVGDAQTVMGCFYCFYRGDWERGLPYLKRGDAAVWKRLAERELNRPSSVYDELALAANWWEAASGTGKFAAGQIKLHAGKWYRRAAEVMPAGETRASVDARLRELHLDANSEAVAKGLRWLTERQLDEGSWTFKSEPDIGTFDNHLAATAMALRALVEADPSAAESKNRIAIRNGLEFLRRRGKSGDYRGVTEPRSNLYVQAVATIALCEGYAFTRDATLRKESQQAVQFILAAQDTSSGGWRYKPRESPGDLTSTGWQVEALAAAKRSGIDANYPACFRSVGYFLSTVTPDKGASFFLNQEAKTPNERLSAVGLVCRGLTQGRIFDPKNVNSRTAVTAARRFADMGPSRNDAYFNYYATRALHMQGNDDWQSWRRKMAGLLLKTQEMGEGLAGSWFKGFTGSDADEGSKLLPESAGRLGITTLCLLTLIECGSP